ncbi:hypothetical protein C464_00379 [Halorubrum coriense DSM 10284]|uniref:Uncharacterized protein n=1 Tax=Halorubrum coriense DSM 10284 TaxID=1227466 RepID=M0EVQ6_9EURY|nr:hypothetical protein [Halorubrum coriense]ELZ51805.1 hypothetical protein C464_00379 [Halorubrum coriense DSM 10284]
MNASRETTSDRLGEPARTAVGRLRQPEYVGANRCLPCTVGNVAVAAVGAAAVGAVGAPLLGATGFAGALAAIWLRGYLVPGTPELTKRYLPERVLRLFGKGSAPESSAAIDAESYLLSAGVLVETSDGADLAFAPWFASAWNDARDRVRRRVDAGDERAAGVDESSLSLSWAEGAAFAFAGGERIGHWESRPAFLADVAADRALRDGLDGWSRLPLAARSDVLGALRLFVEVCPACEGSVRLEERVVESCCASYDVIAGRCTACDARLFEMRLPSSFDADAA